MERLGNTKPSGLHAGNLRAWGMFFVIAGIIGRGLLQSKLLGVGTVSMQTLLEMMQASQETMTIVTISLILQAMETVAVPIFAFLLAEGYKHTSDRKNYFLRVAGTALLAEIPYNLAMRQQVIDMSTRNPMFGLVLAMILLYLFERFSGKKLICVVMALAGLAWALMLKIEHGIPMVLMVCVIYLFRNKRMFMGFSGMAAAALCTGISPFYLAAPMGFLATHFYNGEPGEGSKVVNYLFYPVSLLVIGLVAIFAM